MEKLEITIFTDPMMRLSYESEPFLRKLETHFPNQITIKNVMSGLVKNVYDFVDPNDLAVGKEYAITQYLPRLAEIYNAERSISGMPIQMENLQLFSTERTSSLPLNLAYKAVQRIDESKAAEFLYRLRFATIAEIRPTTKIDELVRVAEQVGISQAVFLQTFFTKESEADLIADLAFRQQLGVRGLPAYLFRYGDQEILLNGVLDDVSFLLMIEKITQGKMQPQPPKLSLESLFALIEKHKIIALVELQYAFGLKDVEPLRPYLYQLEKAQKISCQNIAGGTFIFSS